VIHRARALAACAAVVVAAGSVGAVELHRSSAAAPKPAHKKLTRAQIGAKKLLAEYAKNGDCGCTGALRAKERSRSGLAKKVVAESGGSAGSP
jgi:hypothetical protein